jgi:hypothetical protein
MRIIKKEKNEDKKIGISYGNRDKFIEKYYKNYLKLFEKEKEFLNIICRSLFENHS